MGDPTLKRYLASAVVLVAMIAPAAPAQNQVVPVDPAARSAGSLADPYLDVPLSDAVRRIVGQLDSLDYAAREAAMQRLVDGEFAKEQLVAALAQMPLSIEQRFRLLEVVADSIINAPRGALGIRMQWERPRFNEPGAVRVVNLLEELPAHNVLRLQDRIYKVDDFFLMSQEDLRRHVQAKSPGDIVRLAVRRPRLDDDGNEIVNDAGEPILDDIALDLELGSADLLGEDSRSSRGVLGVQDDRRLEVLGILNRYGPKIISLTRE